MTPDPRFFYANATYEEAYASLVYGIQERKGFVTLIGETGTGKTTLLRRLMTSLAQPNQFVYLCYSTPSFEEFLTFICGDLGLEGEGKGYLGKIQLLNNFLLSTLTKGGTGILLVDEAQHLGETVLENLRLLSNIETATEKLLQIILVGQPELEKKLAHPNLRQLKQRVAVQCRLDRLKEREVGPFIFSRLRTAGYEKKDLFPPETIQRVALYSKGTPRLVNILCDNALLIAYSGSRPMISPEMVDEVARDLQLRVDADQREKVNAQSGAGQEETSRQREKAQDLYSSREFLTGKVDIQREEQVPLLSPLGAALPPRRKAVLHIGIGALLVVFLVSALGITPERVVATLREMRDFRQQPEIHIPVENKPAVQGHKRFAERRVDTPPSPETREPTLSAGPPVAVAGQPLVATHEFTLPQKENGEESQPEGASQLASTTSLSSAAESEGDKVPFIIVPSGTTVSEIVRKNYKSTNSLVIDVMKEGNPHVRDLDQIQAGEKIWLPPLNQETLTRQEPDGSYRLAVASFRSLLEAERFAQQVRAQGCHVRIVPHRVSRTILLQRVEIHLLEDHNAVQRAWALSPVRNVLQAHADTD